ncbi:MAG: type 4a pilus biogenesis protein PilO [Candidatus Omnitrophica bacterium]|nr:type 4a pilus biogenesis protein PilO [Candidatus Omnitrophota bacterium]
MLKIKIIYDFISHLSKRERRIFYFTVGVLFILFVDRLVIGPIILRIDTLNKEIFEKQNAINRSLQILAQREKIKQQINKMSIFLENLRSSSDEMTSLLKEVERLANKSAVYLVDMKPGGLKEAGFFKKYVINLNCEAQMPQLVEFMYNIESSHRLMTIEKYEITPKSKETGVASCTMTITKIVGM